MAQDDDFHTPFGESLLHPDPTDDQGDCTGHIRDRQTGLSYMQARYQDPLIGRFLSIDPVTFMETGNPVHFNRYAYANNDPVNMIDPDGKQASDLRPNIPPPDNIPRTGDWKWTSDERNSRGGTWKDDAGRSASWEGGTKKKPGGHWDVDQGNGERQRYSNRGTPITAKQAHSYSGPIQKPLASAAKQQMKTRAERAASFLNKAGKRTGKAGIVGLALMGSYGLFW